jgi:hypothetical protein
MSIEMRGCTTWGLTGSTQPALKAAQSIANAWKPAMRGYGTAKNTAADSAFNPKSCDLRARSDSVALVGWFDAR